MNPYVALFRSLLREVGRDRRVALCTVVSTHGSTPQTAGAAMLIHEDMTTEGTLGGGCVEAEVRKQAFELLQRDQTGLLTFQLDHDYGWDDGLICGGTMRVAVTMIGNSEQAAPFERAAGLLERREPAEVPLPVEQDGHRQAYRLHIEAPAKLIIAGAGHVGAEVARQAVGLDFEVVIIDDRGALANRDRLPPPIEPLVGDIAATLRKQPIDAGTFVVIVTRGHKHDEEALHVVIDSDAAYVGMIGSRRKVKLIRDDLAALGVGPETLARLHAPIGLPIGAVTVPEIAVSILAQLIEVRRRKQSTHVEGPFDLERDGGLP